MGKSTESEGPLYSLSHLGENYIAFTEVALLRAGVPQVEIDKVKMKEVKARRQVAYLSDSDPLYMEWMFDKTQKSEQAWRDKVTEIKQQHPFSTQHTIT